MGAPRDFTRAPPLLARGQGSSKKSRQGLQSHRAVGRRTALLAASSGSCLRPARATQNIAFLAHCTSHHSSSTSARRFAAVSARCASTPARIVVAWGMSTSVTRGEGPISARPSLPASCSCLVRAGLRDKSTGPRALQTSEPEVVCPDQRDWSDRVPNGSYSLNVQHGGAPASDA